MKEIFINTIVMLGAGYDDQLSFLADLATLALPISGVEVRQELFSEDSQRRLAELAQVRRLAEKQGWQVRYSIPRGLFEEYGVTESLPQWQAEAAQLQAVSVKMNIGQLAGIEKTTAKELQTGSMLLTIENDQTEANGRLQPVKTALASIQKQDLPLGYTFDLGNWPVMGEVATDCFSELRSAITIFHLKNVNDHKETTLLDQGVLDWRDYLQELDCPVGIEYPMTLEELKNEVELVKEVMQLG